MRQAISVTQLNRFIKDMFTQNQMLYNIMVKGEISNFKESHGNYYFSLKDESSTIQAIIFGNNAYRMDIGNIKDGMSAIITGRVAAYEKAGTYAIYVNSIEDAGLGEYFIRLNELKERLEKEGLFEEGHKKEIPRYGMNIGVVTAKTGAAIKDIIKTIKNKNPYARIILYPAIVQGEYACKSIVYGIKGLDKLNLDTIIIGRGGGSIEDLYAFNDERVARAIYEANTPIISAVGHEINISVSDLVADLKVATPTAAGEAATFSYADFENDIDGYREELKNILDKKIEVIKEKLETKKVQIDLLSPKLKLKTYAENVKIKKTRLKDLMDKKLIDVKSRFREYTEMLKRRDVLDKFGKGFAYITDKKNKKIVSVKNVKLNSTIKMRIKDGNITTVVKEIN